MVREIIKILHRYSDDSGAVQPELFTSVAQDIAALNTAKPKETGGPHIVLWHGLSQRRLNVLSLQDWMTEVAGITDNIAQRAVDFVTANQGRKYDTRSLLSAIKAHRS